MQCEDVDAARTVRRRLVTDQRDAFEPASALVGETRSRMVDENPPHQAGGSAKEMRPIAPFDMPLIDQADVGFVDKGGWLQRMARRLATQLRGCDATEVVVDNRDQLVKRVSSAIADREEQLRDPSRIRGTMAHISVGGGIGCVLEDLKGPKAA